MGGFVFRGCQLPPGFRFQPTDQETGADAHGDQSGHVPTLEFFREEIIIYYLKNKIASTSATMTAIIADVDIYKFDPWELPDKAIFGEGEWFFFSPRDRKYPNGARPNRTAGSGYWKATGTDKPILASGGSHCLGVKKALVFYQGRSPKGAKTAWVMHEYRLLDSDSSVSHKPNDSMRLDDWVLCRVRKKGVTFAPDADEKCAPNHAGTHIDYNTDKDDEAVASGAPCNAAGPDDWSDSQLLQHLMDTSQGVADVEASPGLGAVACLGEADDGRGEAPHRALVSSVLETIKRTLSFGALDELYLLQPSKRANLFLGGGDCGGGDEQSSLPPCSVSADELF